MKCYNYTCKENKSGDKECKRALRCKHLITGKDISDAVSEAFAQFRGTSAVDPEEAEE